MCHLTNLTEQAANLTLDHKLYMARIAMRQVMREHIEVLAINLDLDRPELHIAPPPLPIPFTVVSAHFNPKTAIHSFRAQIHQCGAHIADLVWTSPHIEVERLWAS